MQKKNIHLVINFLYLSAISSFFASHRKLCRWYIYFFHILFLSTLCFDCYLFIPSPFAAEPDAAQALQQLRILQQKFTAKDTQNTVNNPPPKPSLPPTPPPNNPNTGSQTLSTEEGELVRQKAFEGAINQIFPLTPAQLHQLKEVYQASEYAQAATAGIPPKPTATSQLVNLSPGSTPPVIRLSQGFISSLVFLDSTGAPWPISAYDLGDPAAFNIQWDKTSNTIMIQAIKLYNYGNLAIRLRGLNTPVMLTLIPGQKAVDYRVDLRIQGLGPNAKNLPTEISLPTGVSDILLNVLDGVPPAGSQRLVVSGGDARAWLLEDHMYIRTNLTILSPGWLASMTSADGTHAYEMQKSPVLLVSWHGKVMQLKVEGL